ncbi:DUF4179 domain-containing protein [Lentzea sp. NEAU-D13]|uniref:DUF4179 domain-containing protein n=1 Tax=Lentzea alba TaxID=2714351 RepID=A0A7C9RMR4_9PSEU|nr:DUF4179 domain-containing protein [Lentzea alba]NGY58388.1 DUF4179 domain-containing protein [Lentzea alba]
MRTTPTSAATLRRRSIAAVIITVLLALVGGTTPALAAPQPTPVLQQQQSSANDPVDEEYEFYQQLVQDIAEHAEDVEVRDAAKAAERKRAEATENRRKVEEWARTGGPNVKVQAQRVEAVRKRDGS